MSNNYPLFSKRVDFVYGVSDVLLFAALLTTTLFDYWWCIFVAALVIRIATYFISTRMLKKYKDEYLGNQ